MDSNGLLIHVRFSPDGTVTEISERPAALSPQVWFNILSNKAGSSYHPLSGGRATFRLSREEIDALKSQAANGAAA